ncbi:penicillin-binding protein [Adhaeribacter sp. BT258]|uniref:Penicillin-binding protein n=1 Tax=Adhaeribacter terrigena TaxID=2793070 RepID=A0ABS1C401_9BACT|nr:transglycosylase domain-containing protein [Adhaeribacter terrigena]MBK0404125.1 penicillin-binding protein [Adhaeribacter terrigena]
MSEQAQPSTPKPTKAFARLVNWLWRFFAFGLIGFLVYLFLVDINFLFLFGASPSLEKLENPRTELASELYTEDGKLIGKYFRENRSPVKYEKISPMLIKALIATEDVRFYNHSGIDPEAMLSVIAAVAKGENRGGSTITQQLAKNLYKIRTEKSKGVLGYIPGISTLINKTKEWITAVKLEQNYSKQEILTMYLNTVDFGSNSFGIKVAAKTFFGTSPDSLKTEEAAVLVGLLKAPTSYSPRFNPENSLRRRNVVLAQMAKYRVIAPEMADSLSALPIVLRYKVENHYDGPATYFRGAVSEYVKKWCAENGYDLYRDGLKIYTTIDSRLQTLAEQAVEKRMRDLQKKFKRHWGDKNPWVDDKDQEIPGFLEASMKRTEYYKALKNKHGNNQAAINAELHKPRQMKVFTWDNDSLEKTVTMSPMDSLAYYKRILRAGMVTMDPHSGQIKAWVGGINFKYFKYDHVKQAKRQPGSTFKPFVYVTAIDKGYAPCDRMRDQRLTINYVENGEAKSWSPHNADYHFSGANITLRHAMGKSINSITAQLTEKVGWQTVAEYAHKLGIKSPLQAVPSIGLGSSDVSLFELVGAYGTFMNNGFRTEPMYVTRIEDRNGNVIHTFMPKQKKVLSSETAWLMTYMLKGGMEEQGGTSQALWEYDLGWRKGNEVGGKTGTTSNHSDGWYVGVTKDLITGVWVGGDDRSIHFRTSAMGEGSKTALPVFGIFMENVYKNPDLGYKFGRFPKPTVKIRKKYMCQSFIPKPKVDSLQLKDAQDVEPEVGGETVLVP